MQLEGAQLIRKSYTSIMELTKSQKNCQRYYRGKESPLRENRLLFACFHKHFPRNALPLEDRLTNVHH